ncbi:YhcN/YlaJ family sporulation lipoprotein [Bacillus taeanensis]|uniref:Sporulation protein n=1 Tax=Bacillus taeanensis TaxID=273032 RepID=A0A366Y4E0_9BACI|nr:YhcN/YlaJ family sporulation lipoprotein [Bacillus taeanensis]RBW71283.1 sporulation protein [Bacillus taeanensis]
MKKWFLAAAAAFMITGCQADNNGDTAYDNDLGMRNVSDTDSYNFADKTTQKLIPNQDTDQFGYVRLQKNENDSTQQGVIGAIDRDAVADMITRMAVNLPNVNEAATLVTDDKVLIGYQTDAEGRFETADQVKKTALSVIPRYYHVYVSDDDTVISDIERFQNLTTRTNNIDSYLQSTIQKMKQSPQGEKVSDGENPNGVMDGETDEGKMTEDSNTMQ